MIDITLVKVWINSQEECNRVVLECFKHDIYWWSGSKDHLLLNFSEESQRNILIGYMSTDIKNKLYIVYSNDEVDKEFKEQDACAIVLTTEEFFQQNILANTEQLIQNALFEYYL